MSSTNRGAVRAADDFYETPGWCVRAILPHLGPLAGRRILEPSAGRGAIVRELLRGEADASRVFAVEQNSGRFFDCSHLPDADVNTMCLDFLRYEPPSPFDLAVMNPPFVDAREHVEHAISLLALGGTCAALLRLAFVASAKRAPFRRAHPCDLYPLASRPSFTPDGKTDSADYAWFLFGGTDRGRFAVLEGKGA